MVGKGGLDVLFVLKPNSIRHDMGNVITIILTISHCVKKIGVGVPLPKPSGLGSLPLEDFLLPEGSIQKNPGF